MEIQALPRAVANQPSQNVCFFLMESPSLYSSFKVDVVHNAFFAPVNDPHFFANHLSKLKEEHAKLDNEIQAASQKPNEDTLALQRLKKRKLQLKDLIKHIEKKTIPDIIA